MAQNTIAIENETLFQVGRLVKPHGVKGEITLQTECDADAMLADGNSYLVCEMDGLPVPFFLTSVRQKNSSAFLVKFDSVNTEDRARCLTGKTAYIPQSKLPAMATNIPRSITGYTVTDSKHGATGRVEAIDDSTPNILLQVTDNGCERLIPIAFVTHVDHARQTLAVTLPEGFLTI